MAFTPMVEPVAIHLPNIAAASAELVEQTICDYKDFLNVFKRFYLPKDQTHYPNQFMRLCKSMGLKMIFDELPGPFIRDLRADVRNKGPTIDTLSLGYLKFIRLIRMISGPDVYFLESIFEEMQNIVLLSSGKMRVQIKVSQYMFGFEETMFHLLYKIMKWIYSVLVIYFNYLSEDSQNLLEYLPLIELQYQRIEYYLEIFKFVYDVNSDFNIKTTSRASAAIWYNMIQLWRYLKQKWLSTVYEAMSYISDFNIAKTTNDLTENLNNLIDYNKRLRLFFNEFLKYFYNTTYVLNRLGTMSASSDSYTAYFQQPIRGHDREINYFNEARILTNIDGKIDDFEDTIPFQVAAYIKTYFKDIHTTGECLNLVSPAYSLYTIYSHYLISRYVVGPVNIFMTVLDYLQENHPESLRPQIEIILKSEKILDNFNDKDGVNGEALDQINIGLNTIFKRNVRNLLVSFDDLVNGIKSSPVKAFALIKATRLHNNILIRIDSLLNYYRNLKYSYVRLDIIKDDYNKFNSQVGHLLEVQDIFRKIYMIFIGIGDKPFREFKTERDLTKQLDHVIESIERLYENDVERTIFTDDEEIENLISKISSFSEEHNIKITDDMLGLSGENIYDNFVNNVFSRGQTFIEDLEQNKTPIPHWNHFSVEDAALVNWLKEVTGGFFDLSLYFTEEFFIENEGDTRPRKLTYKYLNTEVKHGKSKKRVIFPRSADSSDEEPLMLYGHDDDISPNLSRLSIASSNKSPSIAEIRTRENSEMSFETSDVETSSHLDSSAVISDDNSNVQQDSRGETTQFVPSLVVSSLSPAMDILSRRMNNFNENLNDISDNSSNDSTIDK